MAVGGEGAELAKGYISLSVKYVGAMRQIKQDLSGIQSEATAVGGKAGKALGAGVSGGVSQGVIDAKSHINTMAGEWGLQIQKNVKGGVSQGFISAESEARLRGAIIGGHIGRAIASPIVMGTNLAKKGLQETAALAEHIGGHIKSALTGPMAQMGLTMGVLGTAFGTLEKGWQLDTKIQTTNVQLKQFSGTAQDISGFWNDVNTALKGTADGILDVVGPAKELFQEGLRGDALIGKLKEIQNISVATGAGIEATMELYEKAHGRDVINPMVMGALQKSGIPAREELLKHFGLKDDEEGNASLDVMLTPKKGAKGITTDVLFDQLRKDSEGAAEAYAKTWEGQMHKASVNVASIGGDVLKSILGGGEGDKENPLTRLNEQLEKIDTWVKAHQDDIKRWFHEAGDAAKTLWGYIKEVADALHGLNPQEVVAAFAGWKTISTAWTIGKDLREVSIALGLIKAAGPAAIASDMAAIGAAGTGGGLAALGGALTAIAGPLAAIAAAALAAKWWWDLTDKWMMHGPPTLPNMPTNLDHTPKAGTVQPPPAPGMQIGPGGIPFYPKAIGGISGLPHIATLQTHTPQGGLVNWAEPKTGGEAFIPLGQANRERSLGIWAETGKRIGATPMHMKFDTGGIRGGIGGFRMTDPDHIDFHGHIVKRPKNDAEWRLLIRWWNIMQGDEWAWTRKGPGDSNPGMGDFGDGSGENPVGIGGPTSYDIGGINDDGNSGGNWWGVSPQQMFAMGSGDNNLAAVHSLLATLTGGAKGSKRAPYQMGGFSPSGIDCSGLVSAVVNAYLGSGAFSSRMSTPSEQGWLKQRGFRMGIGPPGTLRVGWYGGGGSSGHTALTLPDGTNVESTTSNGISGVRVGSKAVGADGGMFTGHAWLPAEGAMAGFGGGGPGARGMGMPTGSGFGGGFGGAFGGGSGGSGGGGMPGGGGSGGGGVDNSSGVDYGGGGGYSPGGKWGGGGPSPEAQESENRKERAAQEKIDRLNNEIHDLETKKGEFTDKTKQSEKDRLEHSLTDKKQQLTDAEADLQKNKELFGQQWAGAGGGMPGGGGKGGAGGGDAGPLGSLFDIGKSGLQESLLPPGFINPLNTPIVKSAGALLSFFGGLLGGSGGGGGGLGGLMPGGMGAMLSHPVRAMMAGGFSQTGSGGPQIGAPMNFNDIVGSPGGGGGAGLTPRGAPGQAGGLVKESNASQGGPYAVTNNTFTGDIGAGKADVQKVLQDRHLAESRAKGPGNPVNTINSGAP